jgi:hypothetical protein
MNQQTDLERFRANGCVHAEHHCPDPELVEEWVFLAVRPEPVEGWVLLSVRPEPVEGCVERPALASTGSARTQGGAQLGLLFTS